MIQSYLSTNHHYLALVIANEMIHIKIVGVCGSGKSTLARNLQSMGFLAHQVSQEHSGVPDLWRRRNPPDVLVYLDVSGDAARSRYPHLNLTDDYLQKQRSRLAHALAHAHCTIQTDNLSPDEVRDKVVACLGKLGLDT